VYLGVADVVMDGVPVEHLVVMRRLPDRARLASLVRRGTAVGHELRQVARVLAAFHAAAQRSPTIDEAGRPGRVLALWEGNLDELRPYVGPVLDPGVQARLAELARGYLAGRTALLWSRVEAGRICDGHGDLQAEDIFCLPDGPRILDCIEFDDALRHGDVLADVAFLAMDLERLGASEAAASFLADYREFSGDGFPASLASHYAAYRALVRAKVSCLRHAQGDAWMAQAAANYQRWALAHLERARIRLVLIGGLPGTGKSTLAEALGAERGWVVLRSDQVRKELAGLAPEDPAPAPWREGLYRSEQTEATYRTLFRRAAALLARGESVVLDASFADSRWRALGAKVAREAWAELVELRCETPFSEAVRRLSARAATGDPSDADADVARVMAATADPWPSSTTVNTWVPPATALAAVEALLAGTGTAREGARVRVESGA
jgi:aminoglycoside phosphotransferase family enzyme/predicted kinase